MSNTEKDERLAQALHDGAELTHWLLSNQGELFPQPHYAKLFNGGAINRNDSSRTIVPPLQHANDGGFAASTRAHQSHGLVGFSPEVKLAIEYGTVWPGWVGKRHVLEAEFASKVRWIESRCVMGYFRRPVQKSEDLQRRAINTRGRAPSLEMGDLL